MTSRKLRHSTVNDLRSFWALYVPQPFENSAIHQSMTCGVFGQCITLPLVPRVNGYRPVDLSDPRHHLHLPWHPYAAPDTSGLLRNSQRLPLFLPQLPAVWQLHPTIFSRNPLFFSLTPPKEEGSGYRPYPTHLPTSRGLVPYSDFPPAVFRPLPEAGLHFHCTSAPFRYTPRTRAFLCSRPAPCCTSYPVRLSHGQTENPDRLIEIHPSLT